jgi:hypothetical protein
MTWTYNPALTLDRDWVRFRVGDTDQASQLLANEEIDALLALTPTNRTRAAAAACASIATKLARNVDTSNMSLSVSGSQRFDHYQALAAQLDRESSTRSLPRNLAASRASKEALDADADAVQPLFRRGQDDRQGSGGGNNVTQRSDETIP